MKETRFEHASPCPACGYLADAAKCAENRYVPSPGDLSVCFNCGTLGIFNEDFSIRAPRPEEAGNLPEPALTFQLAIRSRGLLEKQPGPGTGGPLKKG